MPSALQVSDSVWLVTFASKTMFCGFETLYTGQAGTLLFLSFQPFGLSSYTKLAQDLLIRELSSA